MDTTTPAKRFSSSTFTNNSGGDDDDDLDLNIRAKMSFIANDSSDGSSSLGKYLFKCADHLTHNPANKRFLDDFSKHYEMERDLSIVRSAIAPSSSSDIWRHGGLGSCHTSCDDDDEDDDGINIDEQNDLDADMEEPWFPPPDGRDMMVSRTQFKQVHDQLITLSGGVSNVKRVYHNMCKIAQGQTGVNTAERSNTSLMQLCSTTFKDEMDPTRKEKRSFFYAQIYAIIKLYVTLDPEALFVRNSQEAGALDLAALTNKVCVSKYLAMLHTLYGKDVNQRNNKGHTLLHLLARKGDESAETLESLLQIYLYSNDASDRTKLFRMDILNDGKKTPLDVAVACVDIFTTGKDRTLYTKTLGVFHNAIQDDANDLQKKTEAYEARTTFLNQF